ncbi:hypothetical protein N7540_004775 [Penicillium herquei]|nr:hypothetical protein N7540_004775 [Penicillium herquei]
MPLQINRGIQLMCLIRKKEEELSKPQPDEENVVDLDITLQCIEEDWENEINSQDQAFVHMTSYYRQRKDKSKYVDLYGNIVTSDGQTFVVIQSPSVLMKLGFEKGLLTRKGIYGLARKPACRDYHVMYGGREVKLPDGESIEEMFNPFGRVIADPAGCYFHNSASILNKPRISATRSTAQKELSTYELLICPSWINGFSLASKTWCRLAVDPLAEIQWNESAFVKVVLEEKRRTLIHRLVKTHLRDEGAFDDLVQDKGNGPIALLTGTPGVGKTLTAEAVAEVTQRPLYVVATGELGINTDTVDKKLATILDITRRWDCVLLIDEADVFLGSRRKDLTRDALVSIFLRHLEYFRGVAILTTNREDDIDQAFKSRIHFTLRYLELGEQSRRGVWKNFLETLAGGYGWSFSSTSPPGFEFHDLTLLIL